MHLETPMLPPKTSVSGSLPPGRNARRRGGGLPLRSLLLRRRPAKSPTSWRDCLETSRRVLDRRCLLLQEGEMGHFRPVLATGYTPNRGLFGVSRQSLEQEFSEVRNT